MRNLFILSTILFLASTSVFAQQVVESLSFDFQKGYYVVEYKYSNSDSILKGTIMPNNNVSPKINASVSLAEPSVFFYKYKITNEITALQPLLRFSIFINNPVSNILTPDNQWLGVYSNRLKRVVWSKVGGDIPGIIPGESVEFFSYKSIYPPSIKISFSENTSWSSFPSESEGPFGRLDFIIDSLNTDGIKRTTLGPWQPDSSLSLQVFTDTLETFRYRSCEELNWVTNHGVCNSLEVKTRNVKRHIERGQIKQAGNVLNAFLNEVEAQRGKHITEEGYALLYFNARYIRNQLNAQVED